MTIEVLGIELVGYHGVLEEERRRGQRFLVDVWLEPASAQAAVSDAIEDAVDYRDVVAAVREVSEPAPTTCSRRSRRRSPRRCVAPSLKSVARARAQARRGARAPVEHAAVTVER